MNLDYKKYKEILLKYKYPLHSEEELFEIAKNIENLARLFCDSKERSKINITNQKNGD